MKNATFYDNGLLKPQSDRYKWWLLSVMMLGTFMAVLDSTIVSVALPTIIGHYKSSIEIGQWVVSSYLISMSIMLLSAQWFADKYGYKSVYLTGLLIFTLGSLMCNFAPSLEFLIAARFFEGVGSGIIQPLALAMILREFDESKRGLALGFWAMATGAAVSLGPFLGGFLIQNYVWNTIFMINIPVGLLSISMVVLIVKEVYFKYSTKFDVIGFALLVLWIPMFIYGMVKLGSNGANNLIYIGLLGLSLVILLVFILHELKHKNPLIDIRLLMQPNFGLTMLVVFFYGIALLGGNYILPEYLQHTMNYSVYESGLVFLPVGIIQVIISPMSGALIKKFGNFRLIFAGLLVILSYFILSMNFGFDTPKWLIMLSLYLRGIGIGISFTALNHLSFKGLKSEKMGDASAISNTVRQLSGSIGVAILTSVLVTNTHIVNNLSDKQNYLDGIREDFTVMTIAIILSFIPLLILKFQKK